MRSGTAMFKKIISSLREELAPLVRAELRASLEHSVRQELRQELMMHGASDSSQAIKGTSLDERIGSLVDHSSKQVREVVRECSVRHLTSLSAGLEQITKQIADGRKEVSKTGYESPTSSPELAGLMTNLASEISMKMEKSMDLRISELRGTLRTEIEPQIKGEVKQQVLASLHEEVEAQKKRLVEEATHQTLLEYLVKTKWEGYEAFLDAIPLRMRLEAKATLREAMKQEAWDSILDEIRAQVLEDETHPICRKIEEELRSNTFFRDRITRSLRDEIQAQIRDDPQHPVHKAVSADLSSNAKFRQSVAAGIKQELNQEVRSELRESLKPEIRQALETQMLMPVLLGMDGNLEGTVAGVLRANLSACVRDLRDTMLDEIWELATTAILESLGAAVMPVDASGERLLDRAQMAATEAFEPKSAETHERLSAAIRAAFNVIGPRYLEYSEERWRRFARMAQELIDDRLIPASFECSRKLDIPDGFFRAIKTHTCDATKNVIQPGDFYVVMRGLRVGLPLSQETAEELVRRSAANEIRTDDRTIEPPWNGIPFSP